MIESVLSDSYSKFATSHTFKMIAHSLLLLHWIMFMMNSFVRITALLLTSLSAANGFHIVLAGGTGKVGKELSSKLVEDGHDVTILCRNAFLAGAPSRVSSDFGWLGKSFLEKYPGVKLRDWDGGMYLMI